MDIIETDENYWDCNCDHEFIHKKDNGNYCPKCEVFENEMPDSRVDEIEDLYKPEHDKHLETRINADL